MPGITPTIGCYLCENCLVCMDKSNHTSGTDFNIAGLHEETFQLCWSGEVTDQISRSYQDEIEATEQGAACISILLAKKLTEYTIIERSWRGTGIDYWLGYENEPIFQRAARLEISGIKTETATNTIQARFEQKVKQTSLTDDTNLPAYISIVEFSNPKCLFNIKKQR